MKERPFAPLVFGALVFEDLIAVVLMVLLSTLAVSNKFAGGEMLMGLTKLVFFLILWFLVGIYLIPTLLKKAHKYLNDEILLVVSIGLCFVMVTLASLAGFSAALGAFVMGSILAETLESEHIMNLVKGIKDLFGAIFFVSVGMMVDPQVIVLNWGTILVLTITVMAGILFFSTSGAVLAGQGLDNAVHAGFSLAQLGEFSFIIAGLGVSLGVMRGFIYPVNYGYVPDTTSGDGEELDCYILGVFEPVEEFTGQCIAVIHRTDDDDDKLVLANKNYSDDAIKALTEFQERFFQHEIWR